MPKSNVEHLIRQIIALAGGNPQTPLPAFPREIPINSHRIFDDLRMILIGKTISVIDLVGTINQDFNQGRVGVEKCAYCGSPAQRSVSLFLRVKVEGKKLPVAKFPAGPAGCIYVCEQHIDTLAVMVVEVRSVEKQPIQIPEISD